MHFKGGGEKVGEGAIWALLLYHANQGVAAFLPLDLLVASGPRYGASGASPARGPGSELQPRASTWKEVQQGRRYVMVSHFYNKRNHLHNFSNTCNPGQKHMCMLFVAYVSITILFSTTAAPPCHTGRTTNTKQNTRHDRPFVWDDSSPLPCVSPLPLSRILPLLVDLWVPLWGVGFVLTELVNS